MWRAVARGLRTTRTEASACGERVRREPGAWGHAGGRTRSRRKDRGSMVSRLWHVKTARRPTDIARRKIAIQKSLFKNVKPLFKKVTSLLKSRRIRTKTPIKTEKKSQNYQSPRATKSAALSQDRPVGTTEFGKKNYGCPTDNANSFLIYLYMRLRDVLA